MDKWTSRETKLKQRQMNKGLSKPFKKMLEKDHKKKERQRIREAKQAKYGSMDGDDDQVYE